MDTIIDQLGKISKAGTKLADFLQGRSDAISDALSTLVPRPTVHKYCQTDGTGAIHAEVQATVTIRSFRGQAGNSQLPPKQAAPATDPKDALKQPSQTTTSKLPPRSPAATNPPTKHTSTNQPMKPTSTNQPTKPTPIDQPTKPTPSSRPQKPTSNSQQWGRTATVWPSKAAPSPFKPRPPSQAVAQQPSNGRAKSKHPQVLPPDASDSDDELPPRAVKSQVVVPTDSTLAPKPSRRPDHAPPRDEGRPSPKHRSGDSNRHEGENHATKRQYRSASTVSSETSSGDERPPPRKKSAASRQGKRIPLKNIRAPKPSTESGRRYDTLPKPPNPNRSSFALALLLTHDHILRDGLNRQPTPSLDAEQTTPRCRRHASKREHDSEVESSTVSDAPRAKKPTEPTPSVNQTKSMVDVLLDDLPKHHNDRCFVHATLNVNVSTEAPLGKSTVPHPLGIRNYGRNCSLHHHQPLDEARTAA